MSADARTRASGSSRVVVLGVRHHRARFAIALERALADLDPSRVLIEGPPEASPLIAFAAADDMAPPVAIAATPKPRRAAARSLSSLAEARTRFTPFAGFSPEWVAMRWALARGRPARFIDLSVGARFALSMTGDRSEAARVAAGPEAERDETEPDETEPDEAKLDEAWWDDVVEPIAARSDVEPLAFFDAVAAAVAEAREGGGQVSPFDRLREAAMRREIRLERRRAGAEEGDAGAGPILVVCGVWHAPALRPGAGGAVGGDAATLKGVRSVPVEVAWVPWSLRALTRDGGYAAGPSDPAWEARLWAARGTGRGASVGWLVEAARALRRRRDLDGAPERPPGAAPSSAPSPGPNLAAGLATHSALDLDPAPALGSVAGSTAAALDAARLAESLAALRGRVAPARADAFDAGVAALAGGDAARFADARRAVDGADRLGRVAAAAPRSALERDVEALARRLRLALEGGAPIRLRLDLRRAVGRDRSVFLRRLDWLDALDAPLLDQSAATGSSRGAFWEVWRFGWTAASAAALAAAARFGGTLATAAEAAARADVAAARDAGRLAGLAARAAVADLPAARDAALARLRAVPPSGAAFGGLVEALEAVATLRRYGGADPERVARLEATAPVLLDRAAAAALRAASAGAAATVDGATLRALLAEADAIVERLTRDGADAALLAAAARWRTTLDRIARDPAAAPEAQGWCAADFARRDARGARAVLARALRSAPDVRSGRWLDAYLSGGASDPRAASALDAWLGSVAAEAFERRLPMLRRACASLDAAARLRLAGIVAGASARRTPAAAVDEAGGDAAATIAWSAEAIAAATPLLDLLLGVAPSGEAATTETASPSRIEGVAAASAAVEAERLRRWRLALGPIGADAGREGAAAELDQAQDGLDVLADDGGPTSDARLDAALAEIYPASASGRRRATRRGVERLAAALDTVTARLPSAAAAAARQDAAARIDWSTLFSEAAALGGRPMPDGAGLAPDLDAAGDLARLAADAAPEARATARRLVGRVLDETRRRIAAEVAERVDAGPGLAAAAGAAASSRSAVGAPRGAPVDWPRSLAAALARGAVALGPDQRPTVIVERFHRRRARRPLGELIVLLDQSGSMRASMGPAAAVAAALAQLHGLSLGSGATLRIRPRLFAFDHRLVDLSAGLDDPTAALFGATLGGGTDVAGALLGVGGRLERADHAVVALVSDLGEPSDADRVAAAAARLMARGATLHVATALDARGREPRRTRRAAAALRRLGAVCGPATPTAFAVGVVLALARGVDPAQR